MACFEEAARLGAPIDPIELAGEPIPRPTGFRLRQAVEPHRTTAGSGACPDRVVRVATADRCRRRLWYPNAPPVTRENIAWASGKAGDEVEPQPRPRRPKAKQTQLKLSDLAIIEHIACLESMWQMAEQVDKETADSRPGPGRKRLYTNFCRLLFETVALVEGHRGAERTLGDIKTWRRIRRAVKKHHRSNPCRRLPKRPINRSQHYRFAQRHITHGIIDRLQAILTAACLKSREAPRRPRPEGGVDHPPPRPHQMLTGDGTDIRVRIPACPIPVDTTTPMTPTIAATTTETPTTRYATKTAPAPTPR